MTVSELIEILQDMAPSARVLIMSQQTWPFENAVVGVTIREEIMRADADEDGDEEDREFEYDEGTAATDVFIVEGSQLRYGSKAAWDCV